MRNFSRSCCWITILGLFGCGPELAPERFALAPNPTNPFSAVAGFTYPRPVTVHAEYGYADAFNHVTPAVPVEAGTPTELLILGLEAGAPHQMRLVATDDRDRTWTSEPATFHTDPLPDHFPAVETTGALDPGEVVCTNGVRAGGPDGIQTFFCVDGEGVPRWSLEDPDGVGFLALQPLPDGFAAVTNDSRLVRFDRRGALIGTWDAAWIEARARFRHTFIDVHETIRIAEGPWDGAVAVLTGSGDETPAGPRLAYGIAVIDLDAGELLWDWSAHGALGDGVPIDPALDYARVHPDEDPLDWQHGNALVHGRDPDGADFFWMSLRHQDQVVKVDPATDGIAWTLGFEGDFSLVDPTGAPLGPDHWFAHQHAPQLVPATSQDPLRMVLFDNGNLRRAPDGTWDDTALPWSRALVLGLDEDRLEATPIASAGAPGQFYSQVRGDADWLPGDRLQYLVSWPGTPVIERIDPVTGEVLWRATLPAGSAAYRALSWSDLYDP